MPEIVKLWPQLAPGARGRETEDCPSLEIFLPQNGTKNRMAVVVCPGGGYGFLADDHEGVQIAEWLNERGIAAFLLRYRIAPHYAATFVDGAPVQLLDVKRAMRIVRSRASEWNLNTQRIGVWGFSAGGHLATLASTHFDDGYSQSADEIERVTSRPDFSVLAYPVIALDGVSAHSGSRVNLLGNEVPPEIVHEYSPHHKVTNQTPPAFLFHTADDAVVPYQNSVLYFEALRAQNISAALHIFPRGEHGVGLAQNDPELTAWPMLLENWLTHLF